MCSSHDILHSPSQVNSHSANAVRVVCQFSQSIPQEYWVGLHPEKIRDEGEWKTMPPVKTQALCACSLKPELAPQYLMPRPGQVLRSSSSFRIMYF
mmetsp:Transcript_65364/g.142461  ORF Transcript_65364/g.142461 Transcript_65364/m.142461 type:complete len:96 (+) Transcript_65364:313-600(+)